MGKRRLSALLVAMLVVAGCGVRVDGSLRREAAAAQLGAAGSRGGGLAAGPGGSDGASGTSGTEGASSEASGPAPGGSTAAAGPAGAASSGGTPLTGGPGASPLPPGGNGGATDVGVTADSIVVGNVSDLSGPVPGLFQGAVTGTQAYLNYVNSQGGVFGRQLKLQPADSQTGCAQTENAYTGLTGRVFAFVGSFGLYDDCGAQVLGQHTTIPAVQYMLSAQGVALPNDFSVNPIGPGQYATGMFAYYAARLGDAVKHAGTIWSNIPSANAQVKGINAAAESQGWKFTYTRAVGATETNFTTDIVRMQQAGVKVVFVVGATAQICASLIQEAAQQNWHPTFVMPIAYAQNFLQLVGGAAAAEGVYGYNGYAMFFGAADAQTIPEVALYQQWMKRTDASQPADVFSLYGWSETALFVQALRAAGPRATRASVLAALKAIHSFDDNGMVGSADPAGKTGTHCYLLWQIHAGVYNRLDTPPGAYRCDGTLYHG
ncbi:MAG: hypothetical protein NVS1B12_06180 [Acidimicrobiales bacterium]